MKHVRILRFRERERERERERVCVSKKDFKISLNEKRVENWKEKQMYGKLIRHMHEGTETENS